MKTTKLIIITIALLLLGGKAIAQNAKKARQILDKTAAVIGNKGGATANFTISGGKYGRVPGTISIKGQKFTASTSAVKVWFDGRTQWTYMKSTNEVNISTPNEAQRMAMNPYGFVTMYKSGYNLSMKPSGKNTVVHMKATTAGRSVREMFITINRNYQPVAIKMLQNTSWVNISVSNFRAKNLPDAMFRFNRKDFPRTEVIDLR